MKNKKINMIIFILRNLLPASRWTILKTNRMTLQLLHAQTELMMLNRSDIMKVYQSMSKMPNTQEPCVCNKKNNDNMFG